jgi:hypothetical protein
MAAREETIEGVHASWVEIPEDDILGGYDAIEKIVGENGLRVWCGAVKERETGALDAMVYLADHWRAHPDWRQGRWWVGHCFGRRLWWLRKISQTPRSSSTAW